MKQESSIKLTSWPALLEAAEELLSLGHLKNGRQGAGVHVSLPNNAVLVKDETCSGESVDKQLRLLHAYGFLKKTVRVFA